MKKSGFTLIEVLAVLVVLSIIAVITVPTVNKIIRDSKNKLYEEQVSQIISASKKWGTENIDAVGSEEDSVLISLDDLKKSGYLEKNDVIDPRSDEEMNGCVVAQFKDSSKQYKYKYYESECSQVKSDYDDKYEDYIDESIYTFDVSTQSITGFVSSISLPRDIDKVVVDGLWVIPSHMTVEGVKYDVKGIGDWAFSDNRTNDANIVAKLILPDSITTIGKVSFCNQNITSVTIPNSVTEIGYTAFAHNNLTSVTIPNSVTTIGDGAFTKNAYYNTSLSKIINKTGKSFDWGLIVNETTGYNFVTGTVVNSIGNVEVTSE